MLREWILILLFIFVHLHDSSGFIDSLHDTGEKMWKLYSMINKTDFNNSSTFGELFVNENEWNKEIKKQLDDINKRINEFGESMSFGASRDSFKSLPSYIILSHDLDSVETFTQIIHRYYAEFHRLMTGNASYSDHAFRDFTKRITVNVEGAIQVLRKTLTENEELSVDPKNLVSLIGDYAISQREKFCNGPKLLSTILVQLFKTVILAEIKNSLMLFFVNIYQYIGDTDTWKNMNLLSKKHLAQEFAIYVRQFAANLIKTDSSYLRACDPENGTWTQNDSFYELEESIQATIFRYFRPPCKYLTCNEIWFENDQHCQTQYHHYRSVCHDTLAECTYLGAVKACQLKKGPHKFHYVNSTELGFLGRNSECPEDNGSIIEDGTGGSFKGRVCTCNCYWDRNKISLAIFKSHVEQNMVITGLRFLRIHRILCIQLREGKLGKDGRIVRYSERWVSIPENIEEFDMRSVDRMNRVFFFDDLRLPFGFVLTGVKFNNVERENVRGFAIEIFGLPFDYETGTISSYKEIRISKSASNNHSKKPLLFKAVSSVYTNLTQIVSPHNITYVSLERSTLKDDFGQSTLPLFDALPIRLNPAIPLGGIGIFHKGVEGYAGFIALRVYGINYADYFKQFESAHVKDGSVKFNDS